MFRKISLRLASSSYSDPIRSGKSIISTQSATQLNLIPDSVFDYIFIDPPFWALIYVSELN